MNRIFILALFSITAFVSCSSREPGASNKTAAASDSDAAPYQPVTKAEKTEFTDDRLDFYPDDFRKDPTNHIGIAVAWAGIIRSTDANEKDSGDKIYADTVFEHHYFDWVQDKGPNGFDLSISPRGEGLFRMRWLLDKKTDETSAADAEKFAAPGNLAIVYGVPEKVEPDGTIVMRYRYCRVIDRDHYNTNQYDYGRLGDPFHTLPLATNATAKGG